MYEVDASKPTNTKSTITSAVFLMKPVQCSVYVKKHSSRWNGPPSSIESSIAISYRICTHFLQSGQHLHLILLEAS